MGSHWRSWRGAWWAMHVENPPITRKRTQPNTLPFNEIEKDTPPSSLLYLLKGSVLGCVRLLVIGGFSICIADHAPRKLFQPLPTGRLALDAPLWGAAQAGGPLAAKRARASPAEGRAVPRRARRPSGEAPRREPRPRRTVPEADPLDTRHDRLSPVNAHKRLLAALLWRSVVVWLWLPPLLRPSSSHRLAQSSL